MKKFVVSVEIVFAIVLAVMLSGCNKAVSNANYSGIPDENRKISVVATIFPPYDFARAIAKDKIELKMVLPPAAESHSYEPTPQDIIAIQNCDVFIYVGGDADTWVKKILGSMDTSRMKIVSLIDCVDVVKEKIVEGMQDDAHDEDSEPEYDEHVWTSPRNTKIIVKKISDTLCEVDSGNSEFYKTNTDDYEKKLDELDKSFQDVVDNAARKIIVFGDRFPFRYLADAYGLEYYAAFPGCSTETEPSAATVAFLINKIKSEKIPVVFHIELSNEKMADTISEATGAKKMLLHVAHNVSREDFKNGVTYLDIMNNNVQALREALQ